MAKARLQLVIGPIQISRPPHSVAWLPRGLELWERLPLIFKLEFACKREFGLDAFLVVFIVFRHASEQHARRVHKGDGPQG